MRKRILPPLTNQNSSGNSTATITSPFPTQKNSPPASRNSCNFSKPIAADPPPLPPQATARLRHELSVLPLLPRRRRPASVVLLTQEGGEEAISLFRPPGS